MRFSNYSKADYQSVCDFLIEINENKKMHINWNWARWEWMYAHPEFDYSLASSIGLWWEDDKVVGAAIYDMYFGEGFCGVLPGYEELYKEVLDYAYEYLKDDAGLGIALCNLDEQAIQVAKECGFEIADQTENMMCISLEEELGVSLPENIHLECFDPKDQAYRFQWLLWQGFDHGTDKTEFEQEEQINAQIRPNIKRKLSLVVVGESKEDLAYACVWYDERTDYAYVEPVCTIPKARGKGYAKVALYQALNNARKLGAKKAYVISDMEFYEKLGFVNDNHFTFYWKE